MAFKTFDVPGIGPITIYKRRGAGSLRITLRSDGTIRVTIPPWTPYASGVAFAKSRADWIAEHAQPAPTSLRSGQQIGKAHHLLFTASQTASKPASRVKPGVIVITHPAEMPLYDPAVQKVAAQAAVRALRTQAEKLLPLRLAELAEKHGYQYRSVSIKLLKTRWGSCDQSQNISLNLFLLQLPWELIDYVLLHELTHTQIMQHGPTFWAAMGQHEPRTPQHRQAMKAHRAALTVQSFKD